MFAMLVFEGASLGQSSGGKAQSWRTDVGGATGNDRSGILGILPSIKFREFLEILIFFLLFDSYHVKAIFSNLVFRLQ